MSRRRCKGTTKRGTPCKRPPFKAQDHCAAHSQSLGSVRFGSPAQAREAGALGGRPKTPKPADVARQLIEANELAVQRPYWRTLGYEVKLGPDGLYLVELPEGGAKLFGRSTGGAIVVSEHDDLVAQMDAAERLLDRCYGKPKVTTEVSGPDGQQPLCSVTLPTTLEWHAEVAAVLEASHALRPTVPPPEVTP